MMRRVGIADGERAVVRDVSSVTVTSFVMLTVSNLAELPAPSATVLLLQLPGVLQFPETGEVQVPVAVTAFGPIETGVYPTMFNEEIMADDSGKFVEPAIGRAEMDGGRENESCPVEEERSVQPAVVGREKRSLFSQWLSE